MVNYVNFWLIKIVDFWLLKGKCRIFFGPNKLQDSVSQKTFQTFLVSSSNYIVSIKRKKMQGLK